MSPDFKEILVTFNQNEVSILSSVPFAVMKYSEPRYTKDLDIWVEASTDNARKVFTALQQFGAPLGELTAADFAADGFFQMGRPPVRIDILMVIDGVKFAEAWPNRQEGNFDGVPANFIGPKELVINKAASARPQDMIDLDNMKSKRD